MSIRVAIVGSRDCPRADLVREFVQKVKRKYPNATVVSGHGRGVDRWAEDEARAIGLAVDIYPADWDTYGKAAGFLRNSDIVANADVVVAFWDGQSRGTLDTITKARATGKPVFIYDSLGNQSPKPAA